MTRVVGLRPSRKVATTKYSSSRSTRQTLRRERATNRRPSYAKKSTSRCYQTVKKETPLCATTLSKARVVTRWWLPVRIVTTILYKDVVTVQNWLKQLRSRIASRLDQKSLTHPPLLSHVMSIKATRRG